MTFARPDSPAPPACVARLIRRTVPLAAPLLNRAIEVAVDLATSSARCALSVPPRPKSSLTSQSCPTLGMRQAMFAVVRKCTLLAVRMITRSIKFARAGVRTPESGR
jgi:hypothetical protein